MGPTGGCAVNSSAGVALLEVGSALGCIVWTLQLTGDANTLQWISAHLVANPLTYSWPCQSKQSIDSTAPPASILFVCSHRCCMDDFSWVFDVLSACAACCAFLVCRPYWCSWGRHLWHHRAARYGCALPTAAMCMCVSCCSIAIPSPLVLFFTKVSLDASSSVFGLGPVLPEPCVWCLLHCY